MCGWHTGTCHIASREVQCPDMRWGRTIGTGGCNLMKPTYRNHTHLRLIPLESQTELVRRHSPGEGWQFDFFSSVQCVTLNILYLQNMADVFPCMITWKICSPDYFSHKRDQKERKILDVNNKWRSSELSKGQITLVHLKSVTERRKT